MDAVPKINQILSGFLLLFVFLFFAILFLILPLDAENILSNNLAVWAGGAIILIFTIELIVNWLKQAVHIEESRLEYNDTNIWTVFATYRKYADLLNLVLFGILFFVFFGAVMYFLVKRLILNPIIFSKQFFVVAGIDLVYLIVRKPIVSFVKNKSRSLGDKIGATPTYTLTKDGIEIDLKIKNRQNKTYTVKIGFNEIDELRVLSFVEAQTFLKYKVGPNVDLTLRQTMDLYKFMKGDIPRPSVYTIGAATSGRPNVLIRGKDLFYFLAFDNADDLVRAYTSFKKLKKS